MIAIGFVGAILSRFQARGMARAGQTVNRRFTNILKKEGDTWRLWARHANNVTPPPAAAPRN